MNRILCGLCVLSLMLGVAITSARAVTLDDYAYQAQLSEPDAQVASTNANTQNLRRFDVPIEMLLDVVQPDLSDIVVFNAQGQVLPMSVHPIQAKTVTKKEVLPFHVFSRYRQTGQKTVTIEAKTDVEDAANTAQSTTQTVTENIVVQAKAHDYLIELKPSNASPTYDRIELSWEHTPEDQLVSLRVEAGHQLDDLRVIHASKHLTKKLSADKYSKSIAGFSARDRYIRLTLINKLQSFALSQVEGVYREKSVAPMVGYALPLTQAHKVRSKQQSVNRSANRSASDSANRYQVAVPWAIQPRQVVVQPAQVHRVISGDLFVQPVGEDESRLIRRDFQQHNLTAEAAPPSVPLNLPAWPFNALIIGFNQPLDALPTIEFLFPAWQVTFLSDGMAPYTVAWGRYEAVSVAPNLAKLVRQSTQDIQSNALTVTLGEVSVAGGDKKRMAPRSASWRKWLLWACLLLGVLMTAWMAYQLLREMKGQAAKDDGV